MTPPTLKICKQCGKDFLCPHKQRNKRVFCTKSCASTYSGLHRSPESNKKLSESRMGEKNPMFGKNQTNPRSLSNLTNNYWVGKTFSENHKAAISSSLQGIVRSPQTKNKISKANIGRKQSTEQRQNMSKIMTELHAQGKIKNVWRGCKRTWYDSRFAGKVYLHSSYELRLAKWLDDNNVEWKRCDEYFEYEFDGCKRRYTPDFIIVSSYLYIETKGYITNKDKSKWKNFPPDKRLLILDGTRFPRSTDKVLLKEEELI